MADIGTASGISKDGTHYDLSIQKGPVVVLIHGLGLNRHMWQWQVSELKKNYTVLTYDLIGSGNSAPPEGVPSLAMFSRQLLQLLDELSIEQAAVFGFSLGGMISRRFAMDYPGRLWALGILNSAHTRDKTAHDAIQQRVYQTEREGPKATVDAALVRWFSDGFREPGTKESHDILEFVRRMLLANDPAVYSTIYQVLVDGVSELVRPEPPISCPTLVMTADEDYGNSVGMMHAIAAEVAGADVVILPGLRHMAMMEEPAMFNQALLEFLTRVLREVAPPPSVLPHFSE